MPFAYLSSDQIQINGNTGGGAEIDGNNGSQIVSVGFQNNDWNNSIYANQLWIHDPTNVIYQFQGSGFVNLIATIWYETGVDVSNTKLVLGKPKV